jgi:hypothetical protein
MMKIYHINTDDSDFTRVINLALQQGNFFAQRLVFIELTPQKPSRQPGLLINASRCEDIGIAEFPLCTCEIAHLDQTLLGERFQAEVDAPEADTQLGSNLALARGWLVLDNTHDTQFEFIAAVGWSIYGHGLVILPKIEFFAVRGARYLFTR